MGRNSIQRLSEDRKRQVDSGLVTIINAEEAAHLLSKKRKTIKEWVRNNKYGLAEIAMQISGDVHFEYSELREWMRCFKGKDPRIAREVERAVA
jgi:hypothetical protein